MAPSFNESAYEERYSSISKIHNTNERNLFKISSVPGKGKAVIALQDIYPGTLLISEPPLVTTEVILSFSNIEKNIRDHLRTLPKRKQKAYLALHNNYPGPNPLQNILSSNGYPLGAGAEVGGVFETISRINHACNPNSVQAWNIEKGEETIHAVKHIRAGEEITVSYLGGSEPSQERKRILKENFTFDCACTSCELPAAELKKSDARLIRAKNLDAGIGDPTTMRTVPEKVLRNCKILMGILEEEDVKDDRINRLWYDCFQICNFHGDEARASVFLEMYCEGKRVSCGADGSDAKEMEEFVKHPRKHSSWKQNGRWRSRAQGKPSGVSKEVFERWLWREDL